MAKMTGKDTGYVYVANNEAYPIYETSDHSLYFESGGKQNTLNAKLLQSQWGAGTIKVDPNKTQKMSTQAAQSTYDAGITLPNIVNGLVGTVGATNVPNTIANLYDYLTGKPNQHSYLNQSINPLSGLGNGISTVGKVFNDIKNAVNAGDVQTYLDNAAANSNSDSNTVAAATGLGASIVDAALGSYTKPNYLNSSNGAGGVGVAGANAPRLMSAQELASLYGLNYDYDYILGVLNDASDAYYNEVSEKAKKLQEDTLRNQVNLYYQYLDSMRQQRANAVNTGINRGTQAAQEVANYLAHQQQITNALSESNSGLYDLYNQAATKRMENRVSALDKYNSLGTALMGAGANFNANDVQRYAADMSAASQAAYANAYQNAAAYNAQAAVDSAYMNSYLNPANSALLKTYLLSNQNASNLNNAQINYYNAQANALKNNK